MRTFNVTLTGQMPLLMHADSIDWADRIEDWLSHSSNKAKSKAGDDRTPAWKWMGYLYFDDWTNGVVTIPSANIMRSIMGGAAGVRMKGQQSYKAASQSGLFCESDQWALVTNGKTIKMRDINPLLEETTFSKQKEVTKDLGFSLFVKRATVGTSKHIRVRPRFENWAIAGTMVCTDDRITDRVLAEILENAGRFQGLGSWRPGGKTPGQFGTYTAEIG